MEKKLNSEEIHQELISMLDTLVNYFERNNLRYYMVGGTLLGAVRHKGFIPWDDDIDIGMPRNDYNRFIELTAKEDISPNLRVISDRKGTFSNPYAELINIATRVEKGSEEYIKNECLVLNLVIDIFPQDGWPEDEGDAVKLSKKMDRLRYLVQNGRARLGKGTNIRRTLVKTPIILFMKMHGYAKVIKRMNQIASNYDYEDSKYVGAVTYGIYGPGERCIKDEVVDFVKFEFEGREYNAPGCWDKYLTQIYGDYMKLPPVEQRINHELNVWMNIE